ncbi:MAG TPA: S49 family peptidase, partial [Myxococcota bacterium]
VNYDTIAVDDADVSFFSTDAPYSEAALARLNEMVDGIYASFVTKVAAGRNKTFAEIEPVARGRIWSGADAQPRGLVDTLGGWPQTLAAVRAALKLAPDAKLHVRSVPEAQPPLVAALRLLRGGDGDHSDDDGAAQTRTLDATTLQTSVRAALRAAAREPVQALAPVTSVLP